MNIVFAVRLGLLSDLRLNLWGILVHMNPWQGPWYLDVNT